MDLNKYRVVDVTYRSHEVEQLGTKKKFWYLDAEQNNQKWLFKYSRSNTGEHWSEKAAEQIAEALGIPHVRYELARFKGSLGVISKNVSPETHRMVMGNEVMYSQMTQSDYPNPNEKSMRVKEHTVTSVLECLESNSILPPKSNFDIGDLTSSDVFCGYLMLDALISNQDRHHENWAILVDTRTGEQSLCPTYDHAASLGRELTDEKREMRLETKDQNQTIRAFVLKAKSELYRNKTDRDRLTTFEAFRHAVEDVNHTTAKSFWLNKLENLLPSQIEEIFHNVPDDLISQVARDFAIAMVLENRRRLLKYEWI